MGRIPRCNGKTKKYFICILAQSNNLYYKSKEYYKPFTMKQIKDCFRRYDLNGDGTVSLNELRIVLEKCGRQMTQKQIEDLAKSRK